MTPVMPSFEQKQEARLMFLSGRGASEIARTLGLTLRTVQRWFAVWRGGENPKPKREPKSAPIVKVDPEVVDQAQLATDEPKLLGFRGNYLEWDAAITNKFKELENFHREERLINKSLRDEQRAKGLLNGREANSYSQAMARHGEQEFRMLLMGKSDLPTMSQSYANMRITGHVVEKAKGENDNISQPTTITEDTSANPEEHGLS